MNIRKKKVVNVEEIRLELEKESPKLAKSFEETSQKINNPILIKRYWNALVEISSCNKKEILSDDFSKSAVASAVTSLVLQANHNEYESLVASCVALGFIGASVATSYLSHRTNYLKARDFLEINKIKEPELYDVELVFNGYTREDIDTSEYDGKYEYQKKHELYEKYCKDMENDAEQEDDRAMYEGDVPIFG